MARSSYIAAILVLFVCVQLAVSLPALVKREAMSAGDGEAINGFFGFYGNPIYRPYGFGAWGYGSYGFMRGALTYNPGKYGNYMR